MNASEIDLIAANASKLREKFLSEAQKINDGIFKDSASISKIASDASLNDSIKNYQYSKNNHQSLIFVSFSLDDNIIYNYAEEIRLYGGVMVFRGAFQNSILKTIAKLKKINEKGVPAIIDPISFKKYDIQSVPTFVLAENACENCTPIYDRLEGTVTLRYALESFAKDGSSKQLAIDILKGLDKQR